LTEEKEMNKKTRANCLNCQELKVLSSFLNGAYCVKCVVDRCPDGPRLRGARRCLIPGCANHTDEGDFVGDLCGPCHSYLVKNKGVHSQAYRNERAKAGWRAIGLYLSQNPTVRFERADDGRVAICLMVDPPLPFARTIR
jgi:hypothetical protein